MIDALFLTLGLFGLAALVIRMRPRRKGALPLAEEDLPRVSVIVPARDEEAALPALLGSLAELDYPSYEVIVVDDGSTDATATIGEQSGARLVRGAPLPVGWRGKQWACAQGADVAEGELLLFTDADTVHRPAGLKRAVAALTSSSAGLLSALPYHRGPTLWERLLGPFQVLLLSATAPALRPRPGRVFAIGQYLLFTREAYERIGGHASVRDDLVEDLPLAERCLACGVDVEVLFGPAPCEVRMYPDLGAFIAGWRRNFRAGLKGSSAAAPLLIAAELAALSGGGQLFASAASTGLMAASALALVLLQRPLGRFSWLGPVLWPFSVALFCLVSALAAVDERRGTALSWKGRSYPAQT